MKDGEPPGGWIKRWAELGDLVGAPIESAAEGWQAVQRMIDGARGLMALDQRKLEGLLAESKRKLDGLNDPFETDLGAHRWLRFQREEAYSDWLDWIVRQIPRASLVFDLFELPKPDVVKEHDRPEVQREKVLPDNRRLDLVIRYTKKYLVVVEVKTNRPGDQDLEKHKDYVSWMNGQPEPGKAAVLLVSETLNDLHFKVTLWRDCCQELRRMIPTLRNEKGTTVAAMTLAFVGAVEQNVLGLPTLPLACLAAGELMNLGPLFDYLEGD